MVEPAKHEPIQIESYRAVFDLERRIYRIDRFKLNPTGVPVRGVVYFLAVLACLLAAARLPVLGAAVTLVPWYLRYVALPGGVAAIAAVVRLEGRPFHLSARALARHALEGRDCVGLTRCTSIERRWRMDELVLLVDGSDSRLRRMRYVGPGTVTANVTHERVSWSHGLLGRCLRRPDATLAHVAGGVAPIAGQRLTLDDGARLEAIG